MKNLFIMALLFARFSNVGAQSVEEITIYKEFFKGGKTMGLTFAFHDPKYYGAIIDTTNINSSSIISIADFNRLLLTAKKRKHYQMKIAGIRFAGEMTIKGQKHFYLYMYPEAIIDLTDRITYLIEFNEQHSIDNKILALFKDQ